jgi:hypothetical protein
MTRCKEDLDRAKNLATEQKLLTDTGFKALNAKYTKLLT